MPTLRLGFSPCPNDTFIFHALVSGAIDAGGLSFEPSLADVETLNDRAIRAELDVSKVSVGALPYLLDEYTILRTGGAVGRGCGPLIVAREQFPASSLSQARIAIPGRLTTANLLLRLYAPDASPGIALEYGRIMPAVAAGEFDAGLIIHESRFTFQDHGLVQIVDLGEWWESSTGALLPLGAVVARRRLGTGIPSIEHAIRKSVEFAFRNPAASADYVRAHAQELSPGITKKHIELYVNRFTLDLEAEGALAIREVMARAAAVGLFAAPQIEPFLSSMNTASH